MTEGTGTKIPGYRVGPGARRPTGADLLSLTKHQLQTIIVELARSVKDAEFRELVDRVTQDSRRAAAQYKRQMYALQRRSGQ